MQNSINHKKQISKINDQENILIQDKNKSAYNINRLMDLKLPISVELGRKPMLLKDIIDLKPGAVIELKKFSHEPVDIYIDNKKFAEGEVVEIANNLGVRITALVGPDDRIPDLINH